MTQSRLIPALKQSTIRLTSRRYSNINFHSGINLARNYSTLVASHFSKEKQGNAGLRTAQKDYLKQDKGMSRSMTQSKFMKQSVWKNQNSYQRATLSSERKMLINSKRQTNPENVEIMQSLDFKTGAIPLYEKAYIQQLKHKQKIEQKIAYIQEQIAKQKKLKSKRILNYSKIMNRSDQISKIIGQSEQQHIKNKIDIQQLELCCMNIGKQIKELQTNKIDKKNKIQIEKQQIQKLNYQCKYTKNNIVQQKKYLNQIKSQQILDFKIMSNHYSILNQLKSDKAFLLNSIERDYQINRNN